MRYRKRYPVLRVIRMIRLESYEYQILIFLDK